MSDAVERDRMEYDVVIVGGGPAGLACAIRLKQVSPALNVCVLEKGAAIGAHALSGCVLEPGPLDALLPEWRQTPPAICVPAKRDVFKLYTATGARVLPTPILAKAAEGLGVDVFAGFAAAKVLYDDADAVCGVQIGDMGVEKDGTPGPAYAPGPEVRAKLTILAEGARGSLSKTLIAKYRLDADCDPPTFGLGFKELWQLPEGRVEPGLIQHSVGWPVDARTYGGSFLYHLDQNRVYVGYVVGLDYEDPRFWPFEAFQQFKSHPEIRALLDGGELLTYGARTIAAGGWQSLPKMEMPGAMLIGCSAGLVNVPKIKGVHQAIRCGVLAAEHVAATGTSAGFDAKWRASPGGQELYKVRNVKPGFKKGLWAGMANGALETLTAGRSPWTLHNRADGPALKPLAAYASPDRHWLAERRLPPKDRLGAVYFASTQHDEAQPVHLKVMDTRICVERCTQEFGNPCQYFCPANVYEMVEDETGRRLQINAANCVHCKACDIKDPYGIIDWVTPEGGSGPNYPNM